MEMLIPLVFMGVIAGFVTLGVGLNVFQKWAKHRLLGNEEAEERFMAMEERVAELEERVDFTERALTGGQAGHHIPPGDSPER